MDVQNWLRTLGGWYVSSARWIAENLHGLLSVLILVLILWATVVIIKSLRGKKKRLLLKVRAERMTPTEKAQHIKSIVGQGIHDYLFEAWHRGEISADDYMRECRRYGNIFDLSDLLPKQQKLLKSRLRERIKSLRTSVKPEIPGAPESVKKTEEAKAPEVVKTTFMSGFLNWRKAS